MSGCTRDREKTMTKRILALIQKEKLKSSAASALNSRVNAKIIAGVFLP
jgi:hypothetical protein